MSYDLKIFFPHAEFPARAWRELLESFAGSGGCEVRFGDPPPGGNAGVVECLIVVDQSVIDIGGGPSDSACAPNDTRWEIGLSTTMGRSARAWFFQHAIPYHALVFFPGVTVHDCQYHLGRSVAESSWSTPQSWLALAERRLWRMGPKERLIDLGLFTPDGRVRF
jgi:hypothetical protein